MSLYCDKGDDCECYEHSVAREQQPPPRAAPRETFPTSSRAALPAAAPSHTARVAARRAAADACDADDGDDEQDTRPPTPQVPIYTHCIEPDCGSPLDDLDSRAGLRRCEPCREKHRKPSIREPNEVNPSRPYRSKGHPKTCKTCKSPLDKESRWKKHTNCAKCREKKRVARKVSAISRLR